MSPRPFFPVLAVTLLLIRASSLASEPASGRAAAVTTVAEAFARWPHLTTDDQPARIEGVVTGTMPSGAFRLHDGTLGIYVTKSPAGQKLTAGDRVRVMGVLRKGGFSPWVSPHELKQLGRGTFPEARPISYSVLASGAADNQWVEVEGVVRAAQVTESRDFVVLDLGMSGGHVRVLVSYGPHPNLASLVDSAVRVRGTAAVNVNAHNQVVEPSFRVPSFAEITILRPGRSDPFSQPLVPASRVMRFAPGATHHHRVRTRGVVTRRLSDTTVFVRDGDVGLKVQTDNPHGLRTGEVIEAVGFPVMAEGMAVIQHATSRVVGQVEPPTPVRPTLAALLEGTHNSDLVSVRARLVDWVIAGRSVTLIFQTGDQLFKGLYNLPADATLSLPDKNSLVEVSGICVISELEDIWFYQPRSFLLLVADLADVRLEQAPPWWTPERLWRALTITCVVLFAAAGWVWALRRQIGRKRSVIEQQARHAAALEERSRIARELHDTLEQGLTGLSLQMKALETDLDAAPPAARERLLFARQMLRQSRALARNAIRELRSETIPSRLEGLVDGLNRAADLWNHSGALAVQVRVLGRVRALPPPVEHHLLGIGTEAMTNAVKHGRARAIDVAIEFGATDVTVRIRDNGAGFDPAQQLEAASGCFGLLGMRERAREAQGDLRIQSRPGEGTEVVVTVPLIRHADSPAAAAGLEATATSLTWRSRPT